MISRLGLYALSICILIVSACASRQEVALKYEDLYQKTPPPSVNRTVILFLVDGLPVSTLKEEILKNKLPQINDFFIGGKGHFDMARTIFPSLTYPSISTLLTESSVDHHQVLGNIISEDGKQIDFESFTNYPKLNGLIKGKNIFSRLQAKGLRTVSLDFAFHADSSVHLDTKDIQTGVSLLDKDYTYVDKKILSSLQILLKDNDPAQWPEFIFVHVIGMDLTSHDYGPKSKEALAYLEFLDDALGPVFKMLRAVEKNQKRQVVTLLTADHGFDEKVKQFIDVDGFFKKIDPKITVLNEGRYASVFFPPSFGPSQRAALLTSLETRPVIDIVAQSDHDHVFVQGKGLSSAILYGDGRGCPESDFKISVLSRDGNTSPAPAGPTAFTCPESLDPSTNQLYYPYFIANLSHYFAGRFHPDAVIIPKPGVAFTTKYRGQHGGPTAAEIFVPLLIRNGQIDTSQGPPSLSTLLRFM